MPGEGVQRVSNTYNRIKKYFKDDEARDIMTISKREFFLLLKDLTDFELTGIKYAKGKDLDNKDIEWFELPGHTEEETKYIYYGDDE